MNNFFLASKHERNKEGWCPALTYLIPRFHCVCDDDMLSATDVASRERIMLASATRNTKKLDKNKKQTDGRSGTAYHHFFFVSCTKELIPLFLFCTNK